MSMTTEERDQMQANTQKLLAETTKLLAERGKLEAERGKLEAEQHKLFREAFLYPVLIATGFVAAIAGLTGTVIKLVIDAHIFS